MSKGRPSFQSFKHNMPLSGSEMDSENFTSMVMDEEADGLDGAQRYSCQRPVPIRPSQLTGNAGARGGGPPSQNQYTAEQGSPDQATEELDKSQGFLLDQLSASSSSRTGSSPAFRDEAGVFEDARCSIRQSLPPDDPMFRPSFARKPPRPTTSSSILASR